VELVDERQLEDGGLGGPETKVNTHDGKHEFLETLQAIRSIEVAVVLRCLQLIFRFDAVEQL